MKTLQSRECIKHDFNNDEESLHSGHLIRREMVPFLPYVERSRKQQNPPPHKRLQSHETPNFDIIKNWISVCNATHEDHCFKPSNPKSSSAVGPIWLIDIETDCLVPTPKGARYIALSYVWGRKSIGSSCTTVSNLEALQKRGSFRSADIQISWTILQAMELAVTLGLQFLWVDKLCIVQDDPTPTKQGQLDAMAEIYAGAYLTIVAAQGKNADSGLHGLGLRPVTQPEDVETWKHSQVMEWYSIRLQDSIWSSRGWTLQEQLFSRRKVIFQDNTINWECHCACWQEGQGIFDENDQSQCSTPPHMPLVNPSPFPDMRRYARLVSRYNRRVLTFPEDTIDAFAGVLSDLGKVFPGGLVTGLPVFCFDASLLWQPWTPMSRRSPVSPESTNVLPSWSWTGWHGDLNSESLRSAYGYIRRNEDEFVGGQWFPGSWHTYPTVTWSYSETKNGERKQVDQLLPHNTVEVAQSVNYTPPDGWEKLLCPFSSRFFYRKQGSAGEGLWYPIPEVDVNQSAIPVNRSRYIHCRTRRTFLKPSSAFRHLSSSCTAVDLISPNSETSIGVLRLKQQSVFREWGYVRSAEEVCELIELSAGSVENLPSEEVSFDEWRRPWCPINLGKYEFYNVMWIGRTEDDTCERRAVGRVLKKAWDQLATEVVDISIG